MSSGAASQRSIPPVWFVHLAGLLFLAAGFATNPLKITRSFFSDEAVYYTMAYSFAYDGDMQFERNDLVRIYKEFAAGPQGIILKINERDQTIVFGKSFLYSLVAAPFVRVFGTSGFVVLYAILLWLNLFCAYRFCVAFMKPHIAALVAFFYFIANASLVYIFWMTPEYFNMSLVCYGFFFFVAAEYFDSKIPVFRSPYNYFIAALFFACATYGKPTNILLIAPLGIWMLIRKKILPAMITLAIFVLTTALLFGINIYFTGDWNYQGGKRASFYTRFPYERPSESEFKPFVRRPRIEAVKAPPFYIQAFLHNWVYFFFGRYSGLAIYFFPMFFGLLYFLFSKRNGLAWAVYISGWLGILTYMVGIPWNFFGGSGTIGNRYLLNAFAVFLFVIQTQPSKRILAAASCLSLVFTAVIVSTPIFSSFRNSFHQESALFRMLPAEKTLLTDLPTNSSTRARRVAFDRPSSYFAYFLNSNTYFQETEDGYNGFWVKGEREAELMLRAFEKPHTLLLRMKSAAPNSRVTITIDGKSYRYVLKDTNFKEFEIPLSKPFSYDRDGTGATYLYDIKIHSSSAAIRYDAEKGGERYLGVFVRMELPEVKLQPVPPEDPL